MTKIRVTEIRQARTLLSTYRAEIVSQPSCFHGIGSSVAEAVGDLVMRQDPFFEVEIEVVK